jgi:YggT family protein
MSVICTLIDLWTYAVFGRIILSWFPVTPGGVVAQLFSVLYTVTEPVLGPVRRVIPPIGMGLDLSPLIVILGARILSSAIC